MPFRAFGDIPHRVGWKDALRRVIGARHLLKRLPIQDILKALALTPNDVLLDFGCGSGYMTYEMARRCRKGYGSRRMVRRAGTRVAR